MSKRYLFGTSSAGNLKNLNAKVSTLTNQLNRLEQELNNTPKDDPKLTERIIEIRSLRFNLKNAEKELEEVSQSNSSFPNRSLDDLSDSDSD